MVNEDLWFNDDQGWVDSESDIRIAAELQKFGALTTAMFAWSVDAPTQKFIFRIHVNHWRAPGEVCRRVHRLSDDTADLACSLIKGHESPHFGIRVNEFVKNYTWTLLEVFQKEASDEAVED